MCPGNGGGSRGLERHFRGEISVGGKDTRWRDDPMWGDQMREGVLAVQQRAKGI